MSVFEMIRLLVSKKARKERDAIIADYEESLKSLEKAVADLDSTVDKLFEDGRLQPTKKPVILFNAAYKAWTCQGYYGDTPSEAYWNWRDAGYRRAEAARNLL